MMPDGYTEIELGMTNFDGSIDEGFAEALKAGAFFGRHAGWEFNGRVYWLNGEFHEDVWRYRSYRETISAPSLEELMVLVNDAWGWE